MLHAIEGVDRGGRRGNAVEKGLPCGLIGRKGREQAAGDVLRHLWHPVACRRP
jgi:hypothetical protein